MATETSSPTSGRIAKKLTIRVILFSSLLTLVMTGIQIAAEYREDLKRLSQLPAMIQTTLAPAVADAIWSFDTLQTRILVQGINQLEFVERTELTTRNHRSYRAQRGNSAQTIVYQIPVILRHDRPEQLGTLTVTASKDQVLHAVLKRAIITLLKNAFKTVLVVVFMLLIFRRLITRHIDRIIHYLNTHDDVSDTPLILERTHQTAPDELDQLAQAINTRQQRIRLEYQGRKSEAQRREQAEKQLQHLERMGTMGELATSLAHELNQPLSGILGYSDMASRLAESIPERSDKSDKPTAPSELLPNDVIRTAQKTDQLVQCLNHIGNEAERASDIIKRTRTFVQKRSVEKQLVDLTKVSSDSLDLVRHRAQQHNIRLSLVTDIGYAGVMADPVQLQQVLVNLLINSIDALTDGPGTPVEDSETSASQPCTPEIELSVTRTHPYWQVTVIDNGPGIPTELADRLFNPFMTTKAEGMGIGLSICKNIIEAFNGQITAENRANSGACFTLRLPVQDSK